MSASKQFCKIKIQKPGYYCNLLKKYLGKLPELSTVRNTTGIVNVKNYKTLKENGGHKFDSISIFEITSNCIHVYYIPRRRYHFISFV